jgi:single-strand DNA-binding protein
MSGINQATIVGRLGQPVEVRYSAAGTAVVNLSVATSDKYKDVETTEWHRIVAFGKTAELCEQYLKVGDQVGFTGKLQTRKWQDKQGNDRYSTEIVAREMYLLGSSKTDQQDPKPSKDPEVSKPVQDDGFDDIPF